MSTAKLERLNTCRRLRNKGMFIDAPPDPTVPSMSDGFCWCSRTMTVLGPDGKVAGPESCRLGRQCFEAI